MHLYNGRTFAPYLALVTAMLAAGCNDSMAPNPPDPGIPVLAEVSASVSIAGSGAIGSGLAIPLANRQEFDFDVTDGPGGRLFLRDWSVVRANGSVGSITADPAVDAATGINSFTQTSAACVNFGGVGRLDTGELESFSVIACDNGSPGTGEDSFDISLPGRGYRRWGTLSSGEITLSGSTATGTLDVTTATSGSDLDPDGYTVTVDGTTSQAIGTNDAARFGGLAEGSHTVQLTGVAANCTVSGSNPQSVTVTAGSLTTTGFSVSCGTISTVTRVRGLGAIGSPLALPYMNRLEFDFDVTSALTGRAVVRDYSKVRNDGSVGSLTVDAAADPATGFSSFSRTSAACVRFGGIGRHDLGYLYAFTIDACDYSPGGAGADTFHIDVPDRPYSNGGTLTEGNITISTS